MTVKDLGDVTVWVGAVAGALITIGFLSRVLFLRPLKAWITKDFAPRILEPLQAVKAEVTENEGRSLKDAVVRVEARLATLTARFEDHITLHGQVLKTEEEPPS